MISFEEYRKNPVPENLDKVLKDLDKLLYSEIEKYKGILPAEVLHAKAKVLAIEAIKTFDPDKEAALSTHVVSTLRRLARFTAEEGHAIRLPEDIRQSAVRFDKVRQGLLYDFNREPTTDELAEALKWPLDKVKRQQQFGIKTEVPESILEYAPEVNTKDVTSLVMSYIHHDLDPVDKFIFESVTGFDKKPKLSKVEVAEKLKISPAAVSKRALGIARRLEPLFQK